MEQKTTRPAVREAEPVLVSVPYAARMLGVGRTEAFLMVRRGDLRSVKIGRRRLIPVDEIRRFVDRELGREQVR